MLVWSYLFQNTVRKQNISGNADIPEGGLDGFLQAILCTDVSYLNNKFITVGLQQN